MGLPIRRGGWAGLSATTAKPVSASIPNPNNHTAHNLSSFFQGGVPKAEVVGCLAAKTPLLFLRRGSPGGGCTLTQTKFHLGTFGEFWGVF